MKKNLLLLGVMLLFITTLTSCYSMKTSGYVTVDKFVEFRNATIGATHNQIVSANGAPDRQVSDGAGGQILIYENTTTNSVSEVKSYFGNPILKSSTNQSTKYIQYFIDSNSICYDVQSNIDMTAIEKKQFDKPQKKLNIWKTLGLVYLGVMGVTAAVCAIAM